MMSWLKSGWKTIALLGIGVLCVPALGAIPARPGTVNYIEGNAYLDGRLLTTRNIGNTGLNPGQVLRTGEGKAEILLTPGVFLRVDDNSAVKMVSPDLNLTQIALERGRAGVEVDEIYPENNIQVLDAGVATQLLKRGYYQFSANPPKAMVFSGEARVDERTGRTTKVKSHHEVVLAQGVEPRSMKFNAQAAEGELYNWSSLRSQYLSEDNYQIAPEYAGVEGFYPGWYWDPWAWDYTFIGAGPFFSPFGWGFYPPWWGGFYGGYGFWGGGYYGGHYRHVYRGHGVNGDPHGGPVHPIGGFHTGGFRGGGFAGGGFHGGGFGGGGFHGGGGGRR